ncbi:hypothetical protein [uncultured Leifsonia sp.]|uniref:hypothetical protein n=1 Tax=uncultured Leifsonia sp. TaxID=340359 RepID=UPI0028D0FA76|nr:hypothetical protein [uncultured Leifsonia sp.]
MTNDERPFHVMTSGGGHPRGGLPDPSAVQVQLPPLGFGAERARELFVAAVERQHAALTRYAAALQAAAGDVTAPAVRDAAAELHDALRQLPIAHQAYAGAGIPPARSEPAAAPSPIASSVRGEGALGVHPDMLTAIQGDTSQRWELAGAEQLPLAVEVALAADPDPQVRASFLMGPTRSRTVVLLMEQRETDPDVLRLLAQQSYASPDRKLPLVLAELAQRELQGLYELLGLDADRIRRANARWGQAQERRERITVGDALREIGWEAGTSR